MKIRTFAKLVKGLAVILFAALLGGCCGMTSIQSHGGGAGGFASLGAMILGTAAMQRVCEPEPGSKEEDEVLPPPETSPEADEDSKNTDHQSGIHVVGITPPTQGPGASRQAISCPG